MTTPIGEILLQSGKPLLKMWSIDIETRERPFFRHSHTRFEITVVESGSGIYSTERERYPMNEGDVFVFSSNEVHCITSIGENGLRITNLHFEPRYLNQESYISFCFSHSPEFQNRIPADRAVSLRHNHKMIQRELTDSRREYPTAVHAYLNLILVELLREHNYAMDAADSLHGILPVLDYIDKHLCDDLRLDTLAAVAGLSPNYFSHLFSKYNGITLWEYITAKRIEKAAQLVCGENDMTMLEIALKCGFNNTVNFNKAFKKHKNITPNELRKNPKLLSH